MRVEQTVWVEGKAHTVVLSDEREALLAAQAAGRAVVGIRGRRKAVEEGRFSARTEQGESVSSENDEADWLPVSFLAEDASGLDPAYLERVVRRHLGLPWKIAETDHLIIREFQTGDARVVPPEESAGQSDQVFCREDMLAEYIRFQYGICGYGIWAVTEKESGRLVGKAGVSRMERTEESGGGRGMRSGEKRAKERGKNSGRECSLPEPERGLVIMELPECEEGEGSPESERLPVLWIELGYHIFEPYRRKGYGTEACRALLTALRREYGEEARCRFYAKTDAGNLASVRLLLSCGFRPKAAADT